MAGFSITALIVFTHASPAAAQNITIQQPAISSFEVGTTVSVPDQGRAFLGGVGRGATSRSAYGPTPMNNNIGSAFQGTSISTRAWIHDFESLDRQGLAAVESPGRGMRPSTSSRHAAHAWRTLHEAQSRERVTQGDPNERQPISNLAADASRVSDSPQRGSLSTAELYARGMKAEAAGKRGVAMAFLRLARERGSAAAARELAVMEADGRSNSKQAEEAAGEGVPSTETARPRHGGS